MNGTEIILKSTDRRSNSSRFLYVQGLIHGYLIVFISRLIRSNCFSKMWRISLPRIFQNNDLQCKLKTAGVITNDGFSEFIILYNALCTMHAGETMHCKPCYNIGLCVLDVMGKTFSLPCVLAFFASIRLVSSTIIKLSIPHYAVE